MSKKGIPSKITILVIGLSLGLITSPWIIEAELVGNNNQASLTFFPSIGSYNIGDSFEVDIRLDTNGQPVVVVAAYIKYDQNHFRADQIDITDSVFIMEAEKVIEPTEGKIKISLGIPTPGVNISDGQVATIKFTAISAVNPSSDNIVFDFLAGSTLESNVILDDGQGTDILTGVNNARYEVVGTDGLPDSPDSSSPTPIQEIDELDLIPETTPPLEPESEIYNENETYANCPQGYLACFCLSLSLAPFAGQGTVLTTIDSDKIYLIIGNQRRWLVNPAVFLSYGLVSDSQGTVSQTELSQYSLGPIINQPSLPEGTLIRAKNDYRVYIIRPPYKRHISNPIIFDMYDHFSWLDIQEVEPDVLNSYITSNLYRVEGDYRIYTPEERNELDGRAVKRYLNITAQQFQDKGYNWRQVFVVNPAERDYYPTGHDYIN